MQQKIYKKDKDLLSNQYDKFSYPNPIDDIEKEIKNNNLYINYDPRFFWNRLWPEKKYVEKDLNVLADTLIKRPAIPIITPQKIKIKISNCINGL